MLVIGGAAACLAYGAKRTTTDIDLARQPPDELQQALELARIETGINVPVQFVGLFEPPYNYEERLIVLDRLQLSKLQIFIPDKHDLALMKTVRGYENDIQAIEEMHLEHPLGLEILVERFMTEMTQAIGDPHRTRLNFLLLVERLYGEQSMAEVQEATKAWPPKLPLK